MPQKSKKKRDFFIHPTANIEKDVIIGAGSKVWHYAQVRPGAKVGKNCIIGNSVFVDNDTEIGDNVKIQNHAIIYHKAIIEDGVFIGPNVCFTNDKIPRAINPDGSLKSADDWKVTTIKIGRGASVGAHSVILPGVVIGEYAMAGSGSVISKDIPGFALVYGNPARIHGFVCQCGKKIEKFKIGSKIATGQCGCGLNIEIDIQTYRQLNKKPSKKIWLK